MFKVTRFCVQPYERRKGGIEPGEAQRFHSRPEALSMAQRARRRLAGVEVWEVTGWPAYDLWDRPRLICREGEVPPAAPPRAGG